uniref:Uncharacterized protein n=1 Tax=Mustela putorius furo TaxID=9669 RepID=M3YME8_MUSPF
MLRRPPAPARPRRLRPPGQEPGRAAGREWKNLGRGRRSAQPLPGGPWHGPSLPKHKDDFYPGYQKHLQD